MDRPRGDIVGRGLALLAGLAIGLRTLQVVASFGDSDSPYGPGMGQGTIIGFAVALAFVGALAVWRLVAHRDGAGGPRLAVLAGGMIAGGTIGAIVFGPS